MAGEPFAERVRALRNSWLERRQVKGLASAHDFDSQFRLLVTLHGWTSQAAEDVREVYEEVLHLRVSPVPRPDRADTGFSVTVADAFVLSFRLVERSRMGTAGWFVAVSMSGTAATGSPVAAGPHRRHGQWTRGGVEDLLLTLLGAYERSLSDGDTSLRGDARVGARGA